MKRKKKPLFSSPEEFEQNMLALEFGEEKPIFEILNVDPEDYPSPESLTKRQIKRKYKRLKRKLEKKSFVLEFTGQIPCLDAYRYLAGTLLFEKESIHLAKGYTCLITGCGGDCPDCFQLNYCDFKYHAWTDEKINKEIERRQRDGIQNQLLNC